MFSMLLAATVSVAFSVTNDTPALRRYALVSATVPLPPGAAKDTRQLRVLGYDQLSVPAQIESLATWPDGSVRWVRALFTTTIESADTQRWTLTNGRSTARPAHFARARAEDGQVVLESGVCRYEAGRLLGALTVQPASGDALVASAADETAIAAAGPIVAACQREGWLTRGAERLFRYRQRFAVVGGQPAVRVMVTVEPAFASPAPPLKSIALDIQPHLQRLQSVAIGTGSGARSFQPGAAWRLEQLVAPLNTRSDRHHPGWVNWRGDGDALFFGARTFWQHAPQALELKSDGSVRYELLAAAAPPLQLQAGRRVTRHFMLWFHREGDDFAEAQAELSQPLTVAVAGPDAPPQTDEF
jgi:hypothetical protein